ncbi:hypothetical protein NQZ68_013981 [Dissostichus eleginoides]|nr:hypothetical protein NQZ68_013981 [Dissostichus eleginoides]
MAGRPTQWELRYVHLRILLQRFNRHLTLVFIRICEDNVRELGQLEERILSSQGAATPLPFSHTEHFGG